MPPPRHSTRWLVRLAILALGFAVVGVGAFWKRQSLLHALLYHEPVSLDEAFHDAINGADRLVIRRGGFDCCRSVEDDPALFTVAGQSAVEEIASQIHLQPLIITNSSELPECGCCGYPGMDWYRGSKRVALISVHHGKMLRWSGFSTARILGRTVSYADAPLLPESGVWLNNWLAAHGASESQFDSLQEQDANKLVGRTGASGSVEDTNRTPSAAGFRR